MRNIGKLVLYRGDIKFSVKVMRLVKQPRVPEVLLMSLIIIWTSEIIVLVTDAAVVFC